ncbi:venom serine carboxypeptidase-like [Venturia canescens]|uniref:venom serine carboxypeptidase-like n=1 Tax=Venturia canescens TaxID=32260 RepID=UPI001C9CC555|nr:venom serine carboxypeptidase-like [Venturia canescens]
MSFRVNLSGASILVILLVTSAKVSSRSHFPTSSNFGVEEPLHLTPLLEAGQAASARDAAKVTHRDFNFESYAGYFTVNKSFDSNLFFWHIAAEENPKSAPVILYLQGSLGVSSMLSLFTENGPIYIDEDDASVNIRRLSWHKTYHVIYIDSPVGSGFSYTNSEEGYSTNDDQVAANLREALIQFFQLNPQLRDNDFFLAGSNYAGKFIPALGHAIHLYNANAKSSSAINLKGIFIFNGYVDPVNQLVYSKPLLDEQLIEVECKSDFLEMEKDVRAFINANKHLQAYKATEAFQAKHSCSWGDDLLLNFPFNVLVSNGLSDNENLFKFLQRRDIQHSLHVGNRAFTAVSKPVRNHLEADITRSQAQTLATLLNYYRVLIVSSYGDTYCLPENIENYLSKLTWSRASEYKNSPIQESENYIEGKERLKRGGNLAYLWIEESDHWITDQNSDKVLIVLKKWTKDSFKK